MFFTSLTLLTFLTLFNAHQSHLINEANIVVQNPSTAINVNDHRKLKACAIKPINGGPRRNPKKPIVETAVNATPADIFFDFPAELYTKGTTEETPMPTNKNPIVAGTIKGKATAVNKPAAITIPLDCKIFCLPNLVTILSPIKRPPAIVPMNAA